MDSSDTVHLLERGLSGACALVKRCRRMVMRWHLNAFAKETIVVTIISVLNSHVQRTHLLMQQMGVDDR